MLMSFLVGLGTGILSGWGVGGGSLLLLYLTAAAGLGQRTAQGINLLYFLACSVAALRGHLRRGLVEGELFLPAVLGGALGVIPAALGGAMLAPALLRRLFGVFLLVVGLRELLRK